MERLSRLVGGEGDEVFRRMPSGINTCTEGLIGLEVHFLQLTVRHNHGTTIALAHMEEHVVRLEVLVGVAVDALAHFLGTDRHVVVNFSLIEIGEVALVDAQLLVCYIGRLDGTVGNVFIDGVFCHVDVEGLVSLPFVTNLGKHLYLDFLSLGGRFPRGRCWMPCFPLADLSISVHSVSSISTF